MEKIIGFDAKRANANRTGLGNYSRFVIDALASTSYEAQWRMYIPRRKSNPEYDALLDYPRVTTHLPQKKAWRRLASLWRTRAMTGDLQRDGVQLFHGLSNELPVGLDKAGIRSVVTILFFYVIPNFINRPIGRSIHGNSIGLVVMPTRLWR